MRRLMLLAAIVLFAVSTGVLLRVATDDTSSKSVSQVQVHPIPFGVPNGNAFELPAGTSFSIMYYEAFLPFTYNEVFPPSEVLFLEHGDSWMAFDKENWRPFSTDEVYSYGGPYIMPKDRQFFKELLERLIVALPEHRAALESARDIHTAEGADVPEPRLSPAQKAKQLFEASAE